MSGPKMSLQAMNERMASSPYPRWLGIQVTGFEDGVLHLEVPWRAEYSGAPGRENAHGGVLAAVIDTSTSYAIATELGKPLSTIDLHIDYHRPVAGQTMRIESRVVKLGRKLATAHAAIYTPDGKLAVTGRGLFVVN